jgi:toxin ParE1/3/4
VTGRCIISPRAQGDLDEIWTYTTKRWGIDQAEFYIREIGKRIEAVAARPAMGRACPEIRRGYHKYRAGSHVLFYRLIDGGIEVVRILHEQMDFGRHL